MEPHKELSLTKDLVPDLDGTPGEYFRKARAFVERFYPEQLEAFASVKFGDVGPDEFFQEYVWVVHATGFSAKAVGKFMPRLMKAYGSWEDLGGEEFDRAFERVREACNNPAKARAVWRTSGGMREELRPWDPGLGLRWERYRDSKLSSPDLLKELPYVGPVTCFHLARNIGLLECVKPDLHLVRMAEHWGYGDCVSMCEDLRPEGMPLGIVDLILWYAASTFGTTELKQKAGR